MNLPELNIFEVRVDIYMSICLQRVTKEIWEKAI